jgi:Tfp pilus assembly protein PilV
MQIKPGAQRGVSIVEAMVALAIMGFGMLAVVGIQATMRLNADIAKQRSEATRFGQEAMEELRAFTVIDVTAGQRSWSDIVASAAEDVVGVATNTTYRVSRAVVDYANPPAKTLTVTVTWKDRTEQDQQVSLRSVIAAAAPALSGTLAVRAGTAVGAPTRRPFRRHPSIPVLARDFGDGRSAWVPPFRSWVVLVFDNTSGQITGICDVGFDSGLSNDDVTPGDVASCSNNTLAQLLRGFVRFNRDFGGAPVSAADAENPPGPALRFRMNLTLTSSGHPTGSFCIDDANSTSTADGALPFGTYYCVVKSNADGAWSGRTELQAQTTFDGSDSIDWEIDDNGPGGTLDPHFRVCRYTPATSDAQTIPNRDHPGNYSAVVGNLTDQNFLVVPGNKSCPTDGPADPVNGDLVNSNTLQHQPPPTA